MSAGEVGLVIGLVVGTPMGFLLAAILAAGKRADDAIARAMREDHEAMDREAQQLIDESGGTRGW